MRWRRRRKHGQARSGMSGRPRRARGDRRNDVRVDQQPSRHARPGSGQELGGGREPVPAAGGPRPEPRGDGAGRRELREGHAHGGDGGPRFGRPRDDHAGQGSRGPRNRRVRRPLRISSAPRSSGCSSSPSGIRSSRPTRTSGTSRRSSKARRTGSRWPAADSTTRRSRTTPRSQVPDELRRAASWVSRRSRTSSGGRRGAGAQGPVQLHQPTPTAVPAQ